MTTQSEESDADFIKRFNEGERRYQAWLKAEFIPDGPFKGWTHPEWDDWHDYRKFQVAIKSLRETGKPSEIMMNHGEIKNPQKLTQEQKDQLFKWKWEWAEACSPKL